MRFFGYKFRRVLVIWCLYESENISRIPIEMSVNCGNVWFWYFKYSRNALKRLDLVIGSIFTILFNRHFVRFYKLQTYYESCDIFMRNHFTNSGNRMEFFALNLFFSNHFKWVLMQTRMLMWRSISIWASMYITQYNKRLNHFN